MKVAVIGGGVAGLAAAYRLLQQGHGVAVFEAGPQLGGLVRTFEVGGERLEAFYHHIFTTDTTIVSLIEELGMGDDLILGGVPVCSCTRVASLPDGIRML